MALVALLTAPTCALTPAPTHASSKRSKAKVATTALVRCITPGINSKNIVEITKPFRVLQQYSGEPDPGYTGAAELTESQALNITVSGKPMVALLATYNATEETSRVGNQVVVIAFFRMRSGKPILIDAVDVSADRFCGFANEPLLRYKSDSDAVVVDNSHFNSSENYSALTAVALVKNRLVELVRDVPTLYCARSAGASLVEEFQFAVGNSSGSSLRPLSMRIKVVCKKFGDDNAEKVISVKQKTFSIPCKNHGSTYAVNLKGKQLTALHDFEKKNGFDTP